MDCDKAHRRMYRYLDGEITVIRRWRITRHLDKCPPCAQGYDFELEVRQVIATRCRDEVPPELKRRIAESLGMALDQHSNGEVHEPLAGESDRMMRAELHRPVTYLVRQNLTRRILAP